MKLSKTQFNEYLRCPKSFWLRRLRPEAVAWPAPSPMDQTRMRDGQQVEAVSHHYIAHRFGLDGIESQRTFSTDTLLARADFTRTHANGSIDIIEVKAATKLKEKSGPNHIVDAAFQLLTAERAGQAISQVFIVHLNSDYCRGEDLDPSNLFSSVDVTDLAREALLELEAQIDAAAAMLTETTIDEAGCDCRFNGVNKRCDAFAYLNPDIPEDSAHHLPRIGAKKLRKCEGAFALADVGPEGLSAAQLLVYRACLEGPIIDRKAIASFFSKIEFPIHFYDYETTGPAIPPVEGYRPYQALPIQFSLHRLSANGDQEHFEWLADAHRQQGELIEALETCIEPSGSVVAWHKSFEDGCNKRLGELFPDKNDFLQSLCARTVDLEEPFKKHYVDWAFRGSTSIKKVLPVLVPDLAYAKDAVHDGTGAVEAWNRLIETSDPAERAKLRGELLDYCRLDSLAMVEIYRVLAAIGEEAG